MNKSKQVGIYDDQPQLSLALMSYMHQLAAFYANTRKQFCIALSGGSLIDIMAAALDQDIPNRDVDWSTWLVFWADERWISWQSPDSNYGVARKQLLNRVPIPESQIHAMDTTQPLDKTVQNYTSTLEKVFKPDIGQYPRFDLILLGIGPDGHTASLFPDHPVLHETRAWVSPVMDAPKPPPNRITLTLPVINNARNIAFVANGPGKADIVARIFNPSPGSEILPAGRVNPSNGKIRWFLDRAAAAGI